MPRRLAFPQLIGREQPLVLLAVAYVLGELVAAYVPRLTLNLWFGAAVGLLLLAFVCLGLLRGRREVVGTVVLLLGSFACGGLLWALNEASVGEHRVPKLFARGVLAATEPVEVWGVINAAPELAPERIYLEVAVERVATLGREEQASGVVRLVVRFAEAEDRAEYDALRLAYGVRLRALTNLHKASGYRNPGAPDFDEMLEYRGYDAVGSIKSPLLIERLDSTTRNPLLGSLYAVRARAIALILRSFTQPTAGILAAAMFGNQHFLAQETAESFRVGGTFHLLVISGSHVAMIALIVMWVTAWLTRSRGRRTIVVIVVLWAYALMVGAQPAVTRATVMLTFALIGRLIFRTAPGLNILAASALVLLAWQPRDLFNPSYLLTTLTVQVIVACTLPLLARLKQLGAWQPSESTPYPPRAPGWLKWVAEVLYWDEAEFRTESAQATIHYRLEKARAACWLSSFQITQTSVAQRLGKLRLCRRISASRGWQRGQTLRGEQWLRSYNAGRVVQLCLSWIVAVLVTTSALQIALLPMMIAHFHRVSLVSPLTNAIQGALMFVLLLAGSAYLLLGLLSSWLAMKLVWVVNGIGWLTAHATDGLGWRRLNFRVPDYGEQSVWIYGAYLTLVAILMIALNVWNPVALQRASETWRWSQWIKKNLSLPLPRVMVWGLYACGLGLLILFGLLVFHPFPHVYDKGRLSITFLDVGQGDAMLISFPQGKLMLLDSGGRLPTDLAMMEGEEVFVEDRISIAEAAVSPYLWRRGIQRLDFIAASHGHSDHVQGFEDIGQSFAIGAALTGVIPTADTQFAAFRAAADSAGAPLRSIARGDSLNIDGVTIEVLTPFREALNASQAANNQSLTLRLRFGQRAFLLTGDIEKEIEARLVAENEDLKTDVLKVAHHGSRSSSTAAFLQRAQPTSAVISVAYPSPFDHPHPETMVGLQQTGARILQTSHCGAITISTDGTDLQVQTFVKCE